MSSNVSGCSIDLNKNDDQLLARPFDNPLSSNRVFLIIVILEFELVSWN